MFCISKCFFKTNFMHDFICSFFKTKISCMFCFSRQTSYLVLFVFVFSRQISWMEFLADYYYLGVETRGWQCSQSVVIRHPSSVIRQCKPSLVKQIIVCHWLWSPLQIATRTSFNIDRSLTIPIWLLLWMSDRLSWLDWLEINLL